MCEIGTERREMRKIHRAIFFLITPGIFMRFLAKKKKNARISRNRARK